VGFSFHRETGVTPGKEGEKGGREANSLRARGGKTAPGALRYCGRGAKKKTDQLAFLA